MALLVNTSTKVETISPQNGKIFSVKEIRELLGGETVYIPLPADQYIVTRNFAPSEFDSLPACNEFATNLAKSHESISPNRKLYGDALIIKSREFLEIY